MKLRVFAFIFTFAILAVTNVYGQTGTNCCNSMALAGQTGPFCTTPLTQVPADPNATPPQQAGTYCKVDEIDTNLSCTSTDPNLKSGSSCGSVPTNKAQANGSFGYDSSGNFITCNGTFASPLGVQNSPSSNGQASTFVMEGTSYSGVTEGTCTSVSPPTSTPSACPIVACTSGGTGTCHRVEICNPPYGWSMQDCACELGNSPIILDIDGKGFNLTSAAGGVSFDISGTGNPVQMAWTAQGAENAFLALPGADGLVHNGQQLFGNFTPQPPSSSPNGFAALAVYDLPANGGNGNGVIDSGDAIYSSLRLWIDENHDGICQPEELHTLASLGVNSISLHYTLSKKVDQYGNVFRYKAPVDPNAPDPDHVGRTAYDVFFVTLPSTSTKNLIPLRGSPANARTCPVPTPTKGGMLSTTGTLR